MKLKRNQTSKIRNVLFSGIPVDEQRLTLGGISLDDELTLDECRVEDESTLYVLLDLEGGGKKRKKKNYSTPKKNKHKRKKVKLAVLKYYKVNSKTKTTIHRRIFVVSLTFRLKIQAKFIVYVVNVHQNNAVQAYSWLHIMIVTTVANVLLPICSKNVKKMNKSIDNET